MNRAEIKARARQNLGGGIFKNEWLMAVLIIFIVGIISSVASMIYIGPIILCGPIMVGMASCFLNASRESKAVDISEFFSEGFSDFGRNFLVGLMTSIFTALWSMLFVIPGIVKAYSYGLAGYIAKDHPEYSWKECIDESKELMNGHKMELFILDLSFIGWYLVGSIIVVGTLWTSAYHYAARTEFYRSLTGDADVVTASYQEF